MKIGLTKAILRAKIQGNKNEILISKKMCCKQTVIYIYFR